MTNWTAIAQARGLDIPEEAVKKIAPGLTALEEAFRPLTKNLTYPVEPAITLSELAVEGK